MGVRKYGVPDGVSREFERMCAQARFLLRGAHSLINQRDQILKRHIGLNGDPVAEDVSASSAQLAFERSDLIPNLPGCAARQEVLGADTAAEGNIPAKLAFQREHIHGLWLNGMQDITAHVDQVSDYRGNIPVRMVEDHPAAAPGEIVYLCNMGPYEFFPMRWRHD